MRNNLTTRICSLITAILFLTNSLAYGLGTWAGTAQEVVQERMREEALKAAIASHPSPLAPSFNSSLMPDAEPAEIEGVKPVKVDYAKRPYRQDSFVNALKHSLNKRFRGDSVSIEVREGKVNAEENGISALTTIKSGIGGKIIGVSVTVDPDFAAIWNDMDKNDFYFTFPDGQNEAIVSAADYMCSWAADDVIRELGTPVDYPDKLNPIPEQAVALCFLASHYGTEDMRRNSVVFRGILEDVFTNATSRGNAAKDAAAARYRKLFPNLVTDSDIVTDSDMRKQVLDLAQWIHYRSRHGAQTQLDRDHLNAADAAALPLEIDDVHRLLEKDAKAGDKKSAEHLAAVERELAAELNRAIGVEPNHLEPIDAGEAKEPAPESDAFNTADQFTDHGIGGKAPQKPGAPKSRVMTARDAATFNGDSPSMVVNDPLRGGQTRAYLKGDEIRKLSTPDAEWLMRAGDDREGIEYKAIIEEIRVAVGRVSGARADEIMFSVIDNSTVYSPLMDVTGTYSLRTSIAISGFAIREIYNLKEIAARIRDANRRKLQEKVIADIISSFAHNLTAAGNDAEMSADEEAAGAFYMLISGVHHQGALPLYNYPVTEDEIQKQMLTFYWKSGSRNYSPELIDKINSKVVEYYHLFLPGYEPLPSGDLVSPREVQNPLRNVTDMHGAAMSGEQTGPGQGQDEGLKKIDERRKTAAPAAASQAQPAEKERKIGGAGTDHGKTFARTVAVRDGAAFTGDSQSMVVNGPLGRGVRQAYTDGSQKGVGAKVDKSATYASPTAATPDSDAEYRLQTGIVMLKAYHYANARNSVTGIAARSYDAEVKVIEAWRDFRAAVADANIPVLREVESYLKSHRSDKYNGPIVLMHRIIELKSAPGAVDATVPMPHIWNGPVPLSKVLLTLQEGTMEEVKLSFKERRAAINSRLYELLSGLKTELIKDKGGVSKGDILVLSRASSGSATYSIFRIVMSIPGPVQSSVPAEVAEVSCTTISNRGIRLIGIESRAVVDDAAQRKLDKLYDDAVEIILQMRDAANEAKKQAVALTAGDKVAPAAASQAQPESQPGIDQVNAAQEAQFSLGWALNAIVFIPVLLPQGAGRSDLLARMRSLRSSICEFLSSQEASLLPEKTELHEGDILVDEYVKDFTIVTGITDVYIADVRMSQDSINMEDYHRPRLGAYSLVKVKDLTRLSQLANDAQALLTDAEVFIKNAKSRAANLAAPAAEAPVQPTAKDLLRGGQTRAYLNGDELTSGLGRSPEKPKDGGRAARRAAARILPTTSGQPYDGVPLTANETGQHSLIEAIDRVDVERFQLILPDTKDLGPEPVQLTGDEYTKIFQAVGLSYENNVDVIQPRRWGLTQPMKDALRDIRGRKGDIIKCEEYTDENLKTLLSPRNSDSANRKKIVLVDNTTYEHVYKLAQEQPLLFMNVRVLKMTLPDSYDTMLTNEKTFAQARIFMTGWLWRLYEKNGAKEIENILINMVTGCVEVDKETGVVGLLNNTIESEYEKKLDYETAARILKRIDYAFNHAIAITAKIAAEVERVRLMIREFYTTA